MKYYQYVTQELKDEYIKEYFNAINVLENLDLIKNMPYDIYPDIIQEQLLLNQLCIYRGYSLGTVFDTSEGPYLKINKDKYMHLISDKKYIMLPLVKKWLLELNPSLYEKLRPIEESILLGQRN